MSPRPSNASGRAEAGAGTGGPAGLARLERIAFILDDLFQIPFLRMRVGLDALLGLIPWAGDTVSAVFALFIVGSAVRYRVPKLVIVRMALHVAIDYLVGLVPWLGDVGDVFIRANRWNLDLLRAHAGGARKPSSGDVAFVVIVLGAAIAVMIAGIALVILLLGALARLVPAPGWKLV